MQQPHDSVWFVASMIVGIGILGFVLADVWRPQRRGVPGRGWAHQWWRGLMACVALTTLRSGWRAWTGAAALPGWAEIISTVSAILGVVCLIGLVASMIRQQPIA